MKTLLSPETSASSPLTAWRVRDSFIHSFICSFANSKHIYFLNCRNCRSELWNVWCLSNPIDNIHTKLHHNQLYYCSCIHQRQFSQFNNTMTYMVYPLVQGYSTKTWKKIQLYIIPSLQSYVLFCTFASHHHFWLIPTVSHLLWTDETSVLILKWKTQFSVHLSFTKYLNTHFVKLSNFLNFFQQALWSLKNFPK